MPELICAADSPDWLQERRKGITATDITAIVGLSPYESAYSLYFKKRGDIPDEHTDNDRLRLGRELEPIIVDRWQEEHEISVHPGPICLYRSDARPWQMATPDRMIEAGGGIASAVLEVKSWADYDRDRWADGPPARVRAQVLWQMDTLDVATGHVGVLFLPSGEFRSYTIEHDASHPTGHYLARGVKPIGIICDICQDILLLREAGRDFMDRLDLNDPPSPDASSATLAALKARFTDIHHDKTAEIGIAEWELYQIACDDVEFYTKVKRGREATIREQAGEARTLTVNGAKVATHIMSTHTVAAKDAHERTLDYIRRATPKEIPDGDS